MTKSDFTIHNKKESGRIVWVSYARVFVIMALIMMHSFAPFSGDWLMPEGATPIRLYYWIHECLFAALLETFTFISGYLFAFSLLKGGNKIDSFSFPQIIKKKFVRLLIPCWLFGLLYELIFKEATGLSLLEQVYSILNGPGHLWFLPMLFWCFIITSIIIKSHLNSIIALSLCFLLSLFGLVNFPLQLGSTAYYLFFFNLGFYLKQSNLKICVNKKCLILLSALFLLVFPLLTNIRNYILCLNPDDIFDRVLFHIGANTIMLIYSLYGVFIIYSWAQFIALSRTHVSDWVKSLDVISFGIYIVHQFILKFIYYYTDLPSVIGSYYLPWAVAIIATLLSVLVAYIFHRTPVLKNIVG